jgi:hypothetical protein
MTHMNGFYTSIISELRKDTPYTSSKASNVSIADQVLSMDSQTYAIMTLAADFIFMVQTRDIRLSSNDDNSTAPSLGGSIDPLASPTSSATMKRRRLEHELFPQPVTLGGTASTSSSSSRLTAKDVWQWTAMQQPTLSWLQFLYVFAGRYPNFFYPETLR